jgi:hypothetical protein
VLEALSLIAHMCEAQGGTEESRGGRAGSEEAKQGLASRTAPWAAVDRDGKGTWVR